MEVSDTATPAVRSTSSNASPMLWAAYLGASWTWVIGMFLPVLLVRDYGLWSWVIFAVPNVVGAAAMGWVLKSRESSVAFVKRHDEAARLFSLVTIAFHLYFAIWVLTPIAGLIGWIVAAAVVQLTFTPLTKSRALLIWSAVTLLASVGVAVYLQTKGVLSIPAVLGSDPAAKPLDIRNIAGLSAVCLAGFALCPYLDLTFHEARQATSVRGAKIAFGVGFGVLFFSMIVLTLLYANGVLEMFFGRLSDAVKWAFVAHWSLQIIFTVCVHAAALKSHSATVEDDSSHGAAKGLWLGIGLVAGVLAIVALRNEDIAYKGMPVGEVLYRCFMAFYGLVVPAYFATHWGATGKRTPFWLATMALAMPFYWIAFMHVQRLFWFLPGSAVLIVAAGISWFLKSRATAKPIGQTPLHAE